MTHKAEIVITAKDEASRIFKDVGGDIDRFGRDTESRFERIRRSAFSLRSAFVGLGAALAVRQLASAIGEWERLAGAQEQAEAGVRQAMVSMGRYSATAFEAYKQTASTLQGVTTFGDEAILQGTKFLLTYKGISDDVLPRVMETMTDLAALQGGDMKSAANMLGKASMGLTGELRRVGITVDTATYQSEGFLGVLREIEAQVKGQARALADTKYGGSEQFGNQIGDLKEKLGEITLELKTNMFPTLKAWVGWLDNVADAWGRALSFDQGEMVLKTLEGQKATIEARLQTLRDIPVYSREELERQEAEIKVLERRISLVTKTIATYKAEMEKAVTGGGGGGAPGGGGKDALGDISTYFEDWIKWETAAAEESYKIYEQRVEIREAALEKERDLLDKAMREQTEIIVSETKRQEDERVQIEEAARRKEAELFDEAMREQDKYIEQSLERHSEFYDHLGDMAEEFGVSSRLAVQSMLFDAMRRDIDSFSDYWDLFLDRMANAFATALADMAMSWAETSIFSEGVDWLRGAAGWVPDIIGGAADIFASIFHKGGVVGLADEKRLFAGLDSDEVLSVLRKGEIVITPETIYGITAGGTPDVLGPTGLHLSRMQAVEMFGRMAIAPIPGFGFVSNVVKSILGFLGAATAHQAALQGPWGSFSMSDVGLPPALTGAYARASEALAELYGQTSGYGLEGGFVGPGEPGLGMEGIYHRGGIVGKERWVRALEGEGFFTEEQMQRLAPVDADAIGRAVARYLNSSPLQINIYLDNKKLYSGLYPATRDGWATIHPRGIKGSRRTAGIDI